MTRALQYFAIMLCSAGLTYLAAHVVSWIQYREYQKRRKEWLNDDLNFGKDGCAK